MSERPPEIDDAIKSGNVQFLKNAGRKGGEANARKRDIEHTKALLAKEIRELEEWQRKVSANEHLIDPDGNDLDYTEDQD